MKFFVHTQKPYPVVMAHDLFDCLGEMVLQLHPRCKVALLCDDNVDTEYGWSVSRSLESESYRPCRIPLPAGEACKAWAVLGDVLEKLAEEGFTRGDLLMALGGGSTCDLGGLAAALYHRGMEVIYLPTTLLAGVDAAIGGKTAVDLPAGKNLAGVIRQPLAVIFDENCLDTLSEEAMAEGMAEAVKTGILAGDKLWELVNDPDPFYESIMEHCAEYKAQVVAEDELDNDCRLALNLGHTVGHAIERHSGYTVTHGKAVAIGLATMARAGAALGWCRSETAEQILSALRLHGLPVRYDCRPEELLPYLWGDKKRQGETLTAVLPLSIGRCALKKMDQTQLLQLLRKGL